MAAFPISDSHFYASTYNATVSSAPLFAYTITFADSTAISAYYPKYLINGRSFETADAALIEINRLREQAGRFHKFLKKNKLCWPPNCYYAQRRYDSKQRAQNKARFYKQKLRS